jgi:hypothetical protein
LARGGAAALIALALATGAIGCGEDEGVARGATVSVYVSRPLCAEANRELAREGGRAGDLRVRAVCLRPTEAGGRLDLAAVGADARRASEDSTTVAYLEGPDGAGRRFAQPILESAGIAHLTAGSGEGGTKRILEAIGEADSSSLRHAVREALTER